VYPEIALPIGSVRSHHLTLVLAAVSVWVLAPVLARRLEGIARWRVLVALWLFGFAAFAGGRAHFVVNVWSLGVFSEDPVDVLRFWQGLHAPGAILALVIATPLVFRLFRLPVGRLIDILVPSIFVGIAIARVGCFLNGCCFGKVCHGPFCVSFPQGSVAHNLQIGSGLVAGNDPWSEPIHPFQLYLAAIALASAALALWWRLKRSYPGQAALVGLSLYLVGAALIEPLRENYYPPAFTWAGRLQFEWLSWCMAILAFAALAGAEAWHRRSVRAIKPPPPPLLSFTRERER
jgi:phosphatidylglycerol---prolipoprotein diacylglyceryl transferase